MLKIRLIAASVAIVMTLITIYLVPIIYAAFTHWSDSLNAQQQQWFLYSQIVLGAAIALIAFWRWKKKRSLAKQQSK